MAIVRILRSEDESAFSAKRYRNTDTGETLSYRQAKKQLGEPLPTQRLVDRPGGRKLAQQAAEARGVSVAQVRTDDDFRKALRDIRRYARGARRNELNRAQAQTFAAALSIVYGGRRIEWTNYVASV